MQIFVMAEAAGLKSMKPVIKEQHHLHIHGDKRTLRLRSLYIVACDDHATPSNNSKLMQQL
jgi:hypothetical protein